MPHSVDLHRRVDQPREPEACIEPDRARDHEEGIRDDEHVPEVQGPRHGLCYFQLCEEVECRVEEEVEGRRARSQVRPPPPVVVLAAELEVAEDDRDLRTGHDEDEEDYEEEPEYVVELVEPN